MLKILKKINIKIIIILLILVLGALYLFVFSVPSNIVFEHANFTHTGIRLNYEYSQSLNAFSTDGGFFFCSKDGIRFITNRGDTKFNVPLNMREPVFLSAGRFVALSEGGGRSISVFSEEGLIYSKNYDEPNSSIISFSINESGWLSVIVKIGDDYRVFAYNSVGLNPATIVFQDRNIIPIASSMSSNGQILAISSVNFNGLNLESDIRFYYTSEALAGSLTDGIFATISNFSDEIVATLKFMADNRLVAISGSSLSVIEVGLNHTANTIWRYELDNEISHIAFADENTVVVALGSVFLNRTGKHLEGTLLFFDMKNGLSNTYETGSKITFLSGSLGAVVVGHGNLGRNITALDTRGRSLWDYVITQDVKDIQFLGGTSRAVFVFSLSLEVMEIKQKGA